METTLAQNLFLVLIVAFIGGIAARIFKIPALIGYIIAGVIFSSFLPIKRAQIEGLAFLGIILLLFSVGIELSWVKLARVAKIAILGAILQILAVVIVSFVFLQIIGISRIPALILSLGFSLSSTALVIKLLQEKGEEGTIHGEIMVGWLLVQDLAVIPMVVFLSVASSGSNWVTPLTQAFFKTISLMLGTIVLGRLIVPYLMHKVSSLNSREILFLASICFALGIATLTSLLGISPALGAFLAGIIISETRENHAILSEIRPLRDLFMILFFVTLGFLVSPAVIYAHFFKILSLALLVIAMKAVVVFWVAYLWGYKGKTLINLSLGLSQIGEFSFVIYATSSQLKIISEEIASIGVATTLLTLILTPIIFKAIIPTWRKLKDISAKSVFLAQIFFTGEKGISDDRYSEHIIICGYGRVGSWVGKALSQVELQFIVIDYNQKVVDELNKTGILAIFGDPSEPEILNRASVKNAKALVIALPDRVTQEEVITYVQTVNPGAKIYSRVHADSDLGRIKELKVEKIIQPEFEGALAIVKAILANMGRPKEDITRLIKNLRLAHSFKK